MLINLFHNHFGIVGIKEPARDYDIPGTKTSKIFTTIGAAANLVFAFNTGMLPEIQVCLQLNCYTFQIMMCS